MQDLLNNIEKKILKKIKDFEDARDVLAAKEKLQVEGSPEQMEYNTYVARQNDVIYELNSVLKIMDEEKKKVIFPHCLDYIEHTENNYEHGEHGV